MENICEWEDEALSAREFIAKHELPTVVRLMSNDVVSPRHFPTLGPCADTRRPFLFYSKRRRTKAFGYNQRWDETTKSYVHQGPLIEIPKDYAGWFEILPKKPTPKGTPTKYYDSIRSVAASGYSRFLVRTLTGGFRSRDDSVGLNLLEDHMVYPGEVLDILGTATKEWKADEIESQQTRSQPRTEYLKCSDYDGQEICIPMVHPGMFNAVSERGDKNPKVVWHIDDIIDSYYFPITLRLVFGWPPKLPNDFEFSGIITVVEKRRPESLIMYNFKERSTVVIEVPLDVSMRIQIAKNRDDLKRSKVYMSALKRCETSMCSYLINMKVLDLSYDSMPRPDGGKSSFYPQSLMSKAVDMANFSPRDIYPPILEEPQDQVGHLSFRDPVDLLEANQRTEGTRAIPLKPSHPILRDRMTRALSGDVEDTVDTTGPVAPPRRVKDARRSRMEDAENREANC